MPGYGCDMFRLLALAVVIWMSLAASAETPLVDLKLVLAVDASGSVDDAEFALQMQGIAQAFRDPAVLAAIKSGPAKRIAVNLVTWAQHEVPKVSVGWFVVGDEASAERFAEAVSVFPRQVNGATGMGEGIAASLRELDASGFTAPREVVDVSGDGAETPARDYVVMIPQARDMAASRGVTVNGLVILGEAGVEEWYQRNVLVGAGSFLMVARDYGDFAEAIRRKLLREITYDPRLSLNGSW
jgi:uncharacterized protein DUF1194